MNAIEGLKRVLAAVTINHEASKAEKAFMVGLGVVDLGRGGYICDVADE